MSSEIVFFSSSRRSMRSMKARSWPAATVWLLPVRSSDIGSPAVMLVQGGHGRNRVAPLRGMRFRCPTRREESMVFWPALLERRLLVRRSLGLVARAPLVVGHAVDDFPRRLLVERDAGGLGCLAVPVRSEEHTSELQSREN